MTTLSITSEETTAADIVAWSHSLVLLGLCAIAGAIVSAVLLPSILPALQFSLLSTEPIAFWLLSRASGGVAFGLLWLSLASGLAITNKMARAWPGGPSAFDLHQFSSLLGLAFSLFHALILLGDKFIGYSLPQILIPFASLGYAPFWVGLGQVSLYLMVIVSLSYYVRGVIGRKNWRRLHYLSFGMYALVLLHGIMAGTDTALGWVQAGYWFSGASLLFLTIFRILSATFKNR